jgi:hypothetical protein
MNTKRVFILFCVLSLVLIFLVACDQLPPIHTITVTFGEGGSISPGTEWVFVEEGGSQTFSITPHACYQIEQVLVDGVSQGAIDNYTFSDVQQDHTIQASFLLISGVHNTTTNTVYTSIQAAIDASSPGDTIIACPDTYYENIVFKGKSITVQSVDPEDPDIVAATIIDGNQAGTVVRFSSMDDSTLAGFTIQNGYSGGTPTVDAGGGIVITNNSTSIIEYNKIINNTADYGGGFFLTHNSSPTIRYNIIKDNQAIQSGGGIDMNYCHPTIEYNEFINNTAYSSGGIRVLNGTAVIRGNTMAYNAAETYGGAIGVQNSEVTLEDNIFNHNKAYGFGGAVLVHEDSYLLPDDVRLTGWGSPGGTYYRENIPKDDSRPSEPVNGPAGNIFTGNRHDTPLKYTEGAHVYFFYYLY